MPSFQALPFRVLQVNNDEAECLWEEKLDGIQTRQSEFKKKIKGNNGQILLNCGSKDQDPHFLACRLEHEEWIPAVSYPMVGPKAYNFEAIRNFGFN